MRRYYKGLLIAAALMLTGCNSSENDMLANTSTINPSGGVVIIPPESSEMVYSSEYQGDVTVPSDTSADVSQSETSSEIVISSEQIEQAVPVSMSASVIKNKYVGEQLTGADFYIEITYSDGSVVANPEGWYAMPLLLENEENTITVGYQDLAVQINVPATVKQTLPPADPNIAAQVNAAAAVDKDYWGPRIKEKTVYITIDDGPSSNTPKLLDICDQYGIKATWFVCYHPEYEEYYREILRRGHSIAVHSYTHDYDYVYASYENWLNDFDTMYNYIVQVTGVAPVAYRFPGGSLNVLKGHDPSQNLMILNHLNNIGMKYYDWNVSNYDADYVNYDQALDYSFKSFLGLHHPVFLCHDSEAMQVTVDTLPAIIAQYQAWGYSFDKITSDTAPVHQGTAWDY